MAPVCGFCGLGSKINKEHVWPDWITRLLKPVKMRVELRRNEKASVWSSHEINMTVRAFCEACNSGWMSDLEDSVKPVVAPMVVGEAKALGSDDQRLLAAWVMKTAMVAEYFNAQNKYYSARERRWVMDALTPPHDVRIWVARYLGDWKCHNVSDHLAFPRASDGALVPAFCSTLTVGQFAFQVFSYRSALAESRTFTQRRGPWGTTLLPLWPSVEPVGLVWPPRHPITEESLRVLSKRFAVARRPSGPLTTL